MMLAPSLACSVRGPFVALAGASSPLLRLVSLCSFPRARPAGNKFQLGNRVLDGAGACVRRRRWWRGGACRVIYGLDGGRGEGDGSALLFLSLVKSRFGKK